TLARALAISRRVPGVTGHRDHAHPAETPARGAGVTGHRDHAHPAETPARGAGGDAETRGRLHRLAGDHEAWDRLAELYESLAEDTHTPEAAADLLMEVGAIRERQGSAARAEQQYRRILGMRPDDAAARGRLEALYRTGQRW